MKRRDNKGLVGAPSADLLVCFPSRAHLTLMPKPICSPARPSDSNKRPLHHHHHHHHLKRITTRAGGGAGGGGPPSPLLWGNKKQIEGRGEGGERGSEVSEPTSPKVTCAGQIKVRPRASGAACRNWQSVMEEIERIHNRSKLQRQKKANSSWLQPLGFKKDVLNFLTCLRNIRFDFRCFGSFPEPDITSDDDEDDEDEEAEDDDDDQHYLEAAEDQKSNDQGNNNNNNNNSAVFSKWFMVLQDNSELQSNSKIDGQVDSDNAAAAAAPAPAVPPPNALLLMRCRSAPAKSWLEDKENRDRVIANAKKRETEKGKDQDQDEDEGEEQEEKEKQLLSLSVVDEEEKHCKKKRRESLAILMKYDTDFYNMSSDVAQETWVVGGGRGGAGAGAAAGARGGLKDPFSRSRSWRR